MDTLKQRLRARGKDLSLSADALSHGAEWPLIIGHRGASASAPENTIIAFQQALSDGAEGIEFDVRLASDNVPVVIHDADLRRTGLRRDEVARLSSRELSRIDVGRWFNLRYPARARVEYEGAPVPTLEEVLELSRRSPALLYLEMKCAAGETVALATRVARLVQEYCLVERVIVESFALDAIREIKRRAPELRTAALFERAILRPVPSLGFIIGAARDCRADEVALHHSLARPRMVEEAVRHGMATVVWTVDRPAWIERARKRGIQALITNRPGLMRRQRDELSSV